MVAATYLGFLNTGKPEVGHRLLSLLALPHWGFGAVKTITPQKLGVTGVCCVTESLKASNDAASREVTQIAERLNTKP